LNGGSVVRRGFALGGRGFAILALVAGVAAGAAPAAADPAKVVIGVSSRSFNAGFSNMWIGIPLGLYGPTLDPSAFGTQGATQNLQLMLTGQVTMSTGVQDALLNSQAEGRTLPAVIPCVYLRGMIHRISVLPGSSIKSIRDLTGKRIGVPDLANGTVQYIKYAARNVGVDPDSFQLLAVGDNQQAATALTSGRVDAIGNVDVDVARIRSLGIDLRVLDQPPQVKDAAVAYVFAFAKPWYEAHKADAATMLQGMIKAIVVMLENPEATVRISFAMYPQSVPSGVPYEKAVADAVKLVRIRVPVIERTVGNNHRWCEFTPAAWSSFIDMLGLKGKADASAFYTDELIQKINDFDEPKLRAWAKALNPPKDPAQMGAWLREQKPPL
jgi:NitT/TauT family transport system substrate-binding protein